jgi:hypothetical protein
VATIMMLLLMTTTMMIIMVAAALACWRRDDSTPHPTRAQGPSHWAKTASVDWLLLALTLLRRRVQCSGGCPPFNPWRHQVTRRLPSPPVPTPAQARPGLCRPHSWRCPRDPTAVRLRAAAVKGAQHRAMLGPCIAMAAAAAVVAAVAAAGAEAPPPAAPLARCGSLRIALAPRVARRV